MNRLSAFLLSVLLVIAAGCGEKTAETQDEYVETITNVEIFSVEPVVFEDYITLPVVVMPDKQVNVALTGGGKVTKINVDKGDYVRKGDVLLKTDDVMLKAQYDNTAATLEYQEKEFERSEKLLRDKSITEAAYDASKLQLAQARSAYDVAKKQYEDATLTAPISGMITVRNVEVGDILGAGTAAFRLIDTRQVKVQVGIPEKYIADFSVGNTVVVSFDALPGKSFDGEIGYISPEANTSVRTFLAEIIIDNTKKTLKAGIMGNASILRKTYEDAVMIPINAIIETQFGRSMFIARDDATAEERKVNLGSTNDTMVHVLSGVNAGENVIVKGQHDIVDGEKVNISGTMAASTEETNQ